MPEAVGLGDSPALQESRPEGRPLQTQDGGAKPPLQVGVGSVKLEGGARGDLADFGVFDDAAAEFFDRGLEHGAA